MNTEEINARITDFGGRVEDSKADKLNLSSILLRGEWDGEPFVGVGGERSTEEKIGALVDALHWWHERHHSAPVLRLVIGLGDESPRRGHRNSVQEALATLIAARRKNSKPSLKIMLDGIADGLPACPTFATDDTDDRVKDWMSSIKKRLHKDPEPKLVTALSEALRDHPSFRWYRGVTATYWSGRVEGLQVCQVDQRGKSGILKVGGTKGRYSLAGSKFMERLKVAPSPFFESDVISVARAISSVVEARPSKEKEFRDYQAEHRLEALVLRDKIRVPAGGRQRAGLLKPVFGKRPFQFPALWCTDGLPRYIDILMYKGRVPWVVELKDTKYGAGQYYRHAIGQAVLYREFVRKSPAVRDFLKSEEGLDATACRALVAFPNPKSKPIDPSQLKGLQRLARGFNVDMVPVVQEP